MHDEAARAEDTDWRQILGLYELLAALAPGPMVTLNRIVAVAMVRGSAIALQQLDVAGTTPPSPATTASTTEQFDADRIIGVSPCSLADRHFEGQQTDIRRARKAVTYSV